MLLFKNSNQGLPALTGTPLYTQEHMVDEEKAAEKAAPEKKAVEKTAAEEKAPQKKKEKSTRQPSALKRDIQSEKRRQSNRSYRSSVLTAIRSFESSLEKKEAAENTKTKLNAVYGLMDKGVKKGIYKRNKAARTKSRLAARVAKAR